MRRLNEVRRERSAGGVVVRWRPRPEVLLIHDRYGRWSLPKGHLEPGETDEEAALREIAEETGIRGRVLARVGETRYTFNAGGTPVEKTVAYFLIAAEHGTERPQPGEVTALRWVRAGDAAREVGYDNLRALVERAVVMAQRHRP